MRQPQIAEIVRRDARYMYEAYEFMFEALTHTQRRLGRVPAENERPADEHHVSGREISEGAVDLARREFGLLARTVFQNWGIRKTGDFGEVVFNLIEANLLSKTDTDSRTDFQDLFDLDRALTDDFSIPVPNGTAKVASGGH